MRRTRTSEKARMESLAGLMTERLACERSGDRATAPTSNLQPSWPLLRKRIAWRGAQSGPGPLKLNNLRRMFAGEALVRGERSAPSTIRNRRMD